MKSKLFKWHKWQTLTLKCVKYTIKGNKNKCADNTFVFCCYNESIFFINKKTWIFLLEKSNQRFVKAAYLNEQIQFNSISKSKIKSSIFFCSLSGSASSLPMLWRYTSCLHILPHYPLPLWFLPVNSIFNTLIQTAQPLLWYAHLESCSFRSLPMTI